MTQALSVSQVETNLSLQPGALDPARLKGIIEPLADSLFDQPRNVVVRELHRSGDIEFWLVFEELTSNARPSSVSKLAKLPPPPAPHPSNTPIQTQSALGDRLKAAALKDTPKLEVDPKRDLTRLESMAAATADDRDRQTAVTPVQNVMIEQTAVRGVVEDIILQEQEKGNVDQGAILESEQAKSLQTDSRYDQLDSPASVEDKSSPNPPEKTDTMHLEDTSYPIHFTSQIIKEQDLVAATSSSEVTEPVQGAKSKKAENVATNNPNYSPIDAFEFDLVDLLSPADSPAPLRPGTPDVHSSKPEDNLVSQGSQSGGPSLPLTPPSPEEWQSGSRAAPADGDRVVKFEQSSQIQTPAPEEFVQMDALRPTGLVVDLDLSDSGPESDDQFELDLSSSSSSPEPRDEQGEGRPQSPFIPDEVIDDYHARSAIADGSIYAPSSPDVGMDPVDCVVERSDEPPASFVEERNISWGIPNRPPHLVHYTSPLPSPASHPEVVHPPPPSLGPDPRQPVGNEAASSSPTNSSVSSEYQRPEEPRLVCMNAQTIEQETEEHEEDLLERVPVTANSASDLEANFSLDDLSPSATTNIDHFPSTPSSPLSPIPPSAATSGQAQISSASASEVKEQSATDFTQASLRTSPARTDSSGSVNEPYNERKRLGESHIDSPPQIHRNSNRAKRQAPLPSPPVDPLRTRSETPPITPFVDKVFRDLPFAPHLPPVRLRAVSLIPAADK